MHILSGLVRAHSSISDSPERPECPGRPERPDSVDTPHSPNRRGHHRRPAHSLSPRLVVKCRVILVLVPQLVGVFRGQNLGIDVQQKFFGIERGSFGTLGAPRGDDCTDWAVHGCSSVVSGYLGLRR
jgi:hypothetical protein